MSHPHCSRMKGHIFHVLRGIVFHIVLEEQIFCVVEGSHFSTLLSRLLQIIVSDSQNKLISAH